VHPLIVLPARFGSTRIPGKLLSKINRDPLIAHVARRVLSFGLDAEVVVATDDDRIEEAASGTGVRIVRTRSDHKSGTERVAEVVQSREFAGFDRVLNIQADQPLLPETAAVGALNQLDRGFPLGTTAAPLLPAHELDRNRVKVTVDAGGRATLFSRHIPPETQQIGSEMGVFLHLGVYSYTRESLLEWVSLPPTEPEFQDGLEQLRPLHHGMPIGVSILNEPTDSGIDTPQDLANAQHSLVTTRTNA